MQKTHGDGGIWMCLVQGVTVGHAYMCRMQVRWTWLQLCRVGELCLPHCIMSVISEMDMERIYDDWT